MKIPNPNEQPAPKRIKRRKLADDGLPSEMFQDVKRACHRFLMTNEGTECDAYRQERRAIEQWMDSNNIARAGEQ